LVFAGRACALIAAFACCCFAQLPSDAKSLYRSGHFNEVIALAQRATSPTADETYYAALSLAKLNRLADAAGELRKGRKSFPRDPRFPTELAGLAYRDKHYSDAKRDLHAALRLDPADKYGNDFLASLYLLDANLPAALKYWNRAGKPLIAKLQFSPAPSLTPELRERVFDISEGQILTLPRLTETSANLERLNVFYQLRFDLLPRAQSDSFDLLIQTVPYAQPLAGWIGRVLPSLRDLPYQGLDLDFYNIGQRGLDFTSFGRWDPNKERASVALAGPYRENPRLTFAVFGDARNEVWDLLPSVYRGVPAGLNGFVLKRVEGNGAVTFGLSPTLQWTVGADFAYRDFRNVPASPFFANGWTVLTTNKLQKILLDWPDRRLNLAGWSSLDAGRVLSRDSSRLITPRAGLQGSWFPQAKGDRYQITQQMQGGRTFGNSPLDELFMLAMERDTPGELWFRGLTGTTAGRKGSAAMGREYGISQSDLKREIFEIPFLRLDAGPFFDAAWTGDPSRAFGSRGAMTATGGEAILKTVSGIKLRVVYGRDLGGGGAFYTSITR
jgi:tetratricopeptide (TPR) repeat protein